MDTFYAYNLYAASGNWNAEAVVSKGTTLYACVTTDIYKILENGTVSNFVNFSYSARQITIIGNNLFVTSLSTNELYMYDLNDSSTSQHVSLPYNNPFGLCTDWDGTSSTANLYISYYGNNIMSYIPFDGTTLSTSGIKTIDVSASSSGMTRALNLCSRNFGSYKYIYTSNESNTLIQIDVTNIDSCSVTTFLLNFKTVIWGIAVDNQNDKLYAADPFNNNGVSEGIHQVTFSKNATTGIITEITGNTFLIRNASTTSITDGELSTSQLVASLGIHYSSDTNDLYVASKDGKISKLHKLFSSINLTALQTVGQSQIMNQPYTTIDLNSYRYSLTSGGTPFDGYLSELSFLDAGTYTIYIEFLSGTTTVVSPAVSLTVTNGSILIAPRPRISINYGDERNTLFPKMFKTLTSSYDTLNFNSYTYSTNGTTYTNYLSELSILNSGTYSTFYVKYPNSLGTETTSQSLYLVVTSVSKNILPRPRISINYGDERSTLFSKIFKTLTTNYDNLNFNSYMYSTNGTTYTNYLSELSILNSGTYSTFYVKYPDSINNDTESTSQLLYLVVAPISKNILPRPRISINYGDERSTLFSKIFKTLTPSYDSLDFNSYTYSTNGTTYTNYLSELSILNSGTYSTFYVKYPNSLNSGRETTSQLLYLVVSPVSKNILPRPRISINYGDERSTLFSKIFKTLTSEYDNLNFNSYMYSTGGFTYSNYLSELSILNSGTYSTFYVKYPNSLNNDAETISQLLYLVIAPVTKNILPRPRISINYGDEQSTLFSKVFKTLTTTYNSLSLNFNSYMYSTDGLTYTNYLSELSIIDAGTYSTFYIQYPNSQSSDATTISQLLYLIVAPTSKNIIPRPIISINYGDERSVLFSKVFKTLTTGYNDLNFNSYMYSTDGISLTNYLSELSIIDAGTYSIFYIQYPNSQSSNATTISQLLYLTVASTSKNIIPKPRISINYGDERSTLFSKIFKTLTTDYDNLNFNSYMYSTNGTTYTNYLSELSIIDVGTYSTFYVKYPDSTNSNTETISQSLYLAVSYVSKPILPRPRISINYGDERSTLFSKIFKTLTSSYDTLNFNSYTYSTNGTTYTNYLSELSILNSGTYSTFYVKYPNSLGTETTSQLLYLVVSPVSKNILPRPRISINYGDERSTLFSKIFKTLSSGYDNLNFNSYMYSTNGFTYSNYLSELSILNSGTYSTFYVKYPNSLNNDAETISQLLYLVIAPVTKNILPRPRISINYGDERSTLFSKVFKTLTTTYNSLNFNSYMYSTDGLTYTNYLSELSIIDAGTYTTFYLKYPDSLSSDTETTSQSLYLVVSSVSKNILPRPRISINYGDERSVLFSKVFKTLTTGYNDLNFNSYTYSTNGSTYTNYLSQLSILDAGTYTTFYVKYPNSQSSNAETTSQLLYLTVVSTSKNIIPKPRISINYGDERTALFTAIFKTLTTNYDNLNFNSYMYSTNGTTYTNYLSELSILNSGTYSTFYIKYPDSTNSDAEVTSQLLILTVVSVAKNILPKPRISINYGDERSTLFSKIFKTLTTDYDDLNFNSYMYSIDGLTYANYLSELSIVDAGTYSTFYVKYPNSQSSDAETTSQSLYLVVVSTGKNILPKPRISINYGDERSILFSKVFKTLTSDYNNLDFNSYMYSTDGTTYTNYLSELSILDAGTYNTFYIKYPDATNSNTEVISQQLIAVVASTNRYILPKPRISYNYGTTGASLFSALFKTLNNTYDNLDLSLYECSTDGINFSRTLIDASYLNVDNYDSFYIKYPDSLNSDDKTTSQSLKLEVDSVVLAKNIFPDASSFYGLTKSIISMTTYDNIVYAAQVDISSNISRIIKIDNFGNITLFVNTKVASSTTFINTIIAANGYLFVAVNPESGNGSVLRYVIENNSISPTVINAAYPIGSMATEWDGKTNGSFNIYVVSSLNASHKLGYFNGNYSDSVPTMTNIDIAIFEYPTTMTFRQYESYKYLYIANGSTFMYELNITNLSSITISDLSPIGPAVDTLVGTPFGIVEETHYLYETGNISKIMWISETSEFYVSCWLGIYKFSPESMNSNGSIITIGYTNTLIGNELSDFIKIHFQSMHNPLDTDITDDIEASDPSQLILPFGLAYNKVLNGVNVYCGTTDGYIVKMYSTGGITLQYGDSQSDIITKLFGTMSGDYESLDLNAYKYSINDGSDFDNYLSELSILDPEYYPNVRIKYPQLANSSIEVISDNTNIFVEETTKDLIPRPRIVIDYGDDRDTIFSKIFKTQNDFDGSTIDFYTCMYSLTDDAEESFIYPLIDMTIIDAGTYESVYIKYPNPANLTETLKSDIIHLTVNASSIRLLPIPRITINYGDVRNDLVAAIFKITGGFDGNTIDFGEFKYSTTSETIGSSDKYLSELSILDVGTYSTFYIEYPDSENLSIKLTSQQLNLVVTESNKNILPNPRITINYGDLNTELYAKIFKVRNDYSDPVDLNQYQYRYFDDLTVEHTGYLSELSLLDANTEYTNIYIQYPDSTDSNTTIESQQLYLAVAEQETNKNIIPRPRITIDYGDTRSVLFGKIFKVLNTDFDDLDFNMYRYSLNGTTYVKYLSELSVLDSGTYNTFYIQYEDPSDPMSFLTSQLLHLVVNDTEKNILPYPRITIKYGDDRNALFNKIFKTLNSDHNELNFNSYQYRYIDTLNNEYTGYLSELSILDVNSTISIYAEFYIEYPDTTNANATIESQKLFLTVDEPDTVKNILPKPRITINYGDEKMDLFNKIFKTVTSDYDTLDFNSYRYSLNGITYLKYLSELSVLDYGIYETFYIKYPDSGNNDVEIESQKLYLEVMQQNKNIIPYPRVEINYGDERNTLFPKLFKTLTTDYDYLDFFEYEYVNLLSEERYYLAELSILEIGTYNIVVTYPNSLNSNIVTESQSIHIVVNSSTKNLILRPSIIINYGDERDTLFSKIFITKGGFNGSDPNLSDYVDFNNYIYSCSRGGTIYSGQLSELSILDEDDGDPYTGLIIEYPDSSNMATTLVSQDLRLSVNSTSKNILPKPRIQIYYGDERSVLFDKIFKTLNDDYLNLDFNIYKYSENGIDYNNYLSEFSTLAVGTYNNFYIEYPDSTNNEEIIISQKLFIEVIDIAEGQKNLIPRPRIILDYGDSRNISFNKIFATRNDFDTTLVDYHACTFTCTKNTIDYEGILSELPLLDADDANPYTNLLINYPNSYNIETFLTSQPLYLIINSSSRNVLPKPIITIKYGDERNVLFDKIFKTINDYVSGQLNFNLYQYRYTDYSDVIHSGYLSELSVLDINESQPTYTKFYIEYPDTANDNALVESDELYVTVEAPETSKTIIPFPRMTINYGDTRNELFGKVFKVLDTSYDSINFNNYTYRYVKTIESEIVQFTGYLSELSIFDANTIDYPMYSRFYITYPDSGNGDATVESQLIHLTVNPTSKNILPRPRILINYGDERNTLFDKIFKIINDYESESLDFNNYQYRYIDSLNNEHNGYLSELSILDINSSETDYSNFYIEYPDATNNDMMVESQQLFITVAEPIINKNIIPRPRITIDYGDVKSALFTKIFKTLNNTYDDLELNNYQYSTDGIVYQEFLSELSLNNFGTYTIYIQYPDASNTEFTLISQSLYLTINNIAKNIIPRPIINITYGDNINTLFNAIFKTINDYDDIQMDFNSYSYRYIDENDNEFSGYLSELSILDSNTIDYPVYSNIYISYPDTTNGNMTVESQRLALTVLPSEKNILPRPRIIIDYGDSRIDLFSKIFKTLNNDYDDLDFNQYTYRYVREIESVNVEFTGYLSELTILDANSIDYPSYTQFYITYPDSINLDAETESQLIHLIVNPSSKNILPRPRISFNYGDLRENLLESLFKTQNSFNISIIDMFQYKYSTTDDADESFTHFLSELSVLDVGTYSSFYLTYTDTLTTTIKSYKLYLVVNTSSKRLVPNSIFTINYGDIKSNIFSALFKVTGGFDRNTVELNDYKYSIDNATFDSADNYLSEISLLSYGQYNSLYIQYPDSETSDTLSSELLHMTIEDSGLDIVPKPIISTNYGDERNTLFTKIFQTSIGYDDQLVDFFTYKYSTTDNADESFDNYLYELCTLDPVIYDSFYIQYPDPSDSLITLKSQKLHFTMNESSKRVIPNILININYGDDNAALISAIFKITGGFDDSAVDLNTYKYSLTGSNFESSDKYLSELSLVNVGEYTTLYIQYPNSENTLETLTSQPLHLIVAGGLSIVPKPIISIDYGDIRDVIFTKMFQTTVEYDDQLVDFFTYKYSITNNNDESFNNYLYELCTLDPATYDSFYVQYPDPSNPLVTLKSQKLHFTVNESSKRILPNPLISLNYGDIKSSIVSSLFKITGGFNSSEIELNNYKYSFSDETFQSYDGFLSELSLETSGEYTTLYIEYPNSENTMETLISQLMHLTIVNNSIDLIPKPIISINYGDIRNILFNKVFKTKNDYDEQSLDFFTYKYSVTDNDDDSFDNFLCELSILNSGTYESFYVQYPDSTNPLITLKSQRLHLVVNSTSIRLTPNPIITVNYGDDKSSIFDSIFKTIGGFSKDSIDLNNYKYSIVDNTFGSPQYLSEVALMNYGEYNTFYIEYPDSESLTTIMTSQLLHLTIVESNNDLVPRPIISINYGDERNDLFDKLFQTQNAFDEDLVDFFTYKYSVTNDEDESFTNFLSELTILDAGTYSSFYVQYPNPANLTETLKSQKLYLTVNVTTKTLIPRPIIVIDYGYTKSQLMNSIFKTIEDFDTSSFDLNDYKYSIISNSFDSSNDSLSEMSLMNAGGYETFYIQYPNSQNLSEILTSQLLHLTINSTAKDLIPRPIISINYGDTRNEMFQKLFQTQNDYAEETVDFFTYKYSTTDDADDSFDKFLSELTIINFGTYSSFYVQYPNPEDEMITLKSQKLYLTVNSSARTLVPNPIISINYGDERNDIISALFKITGGFDPDTINLNNYKYSLTSSTIDESDSYLSELTILDSDEYIIFYIEYPNPENVMETLTSQLLHISVVSTTKNILPRPRIAINYGDERNILFEKLFKTINGYNGMTINFNEYMYNYTKDSIDYTGYLSELSILDANTIDYPFYQNFTLKYPDPSGTVSSILTSQELYFVVSETEKNLLPKPRIEINYGDERDILYSKIFKTINGFNETVDFNDYKYSITDTSNESFVNYLSEISILDSGTYESFYIKYPNSSNMTSVLTSQQLHLVVNEVSKNILPRPRVTFTYGDERSGLFTSLFKTLNSDYDNLDFRSYKYSTDGTNYIETLADLSNLTAGIYGSFYIEYPDSTNNNEKTISQSIYLSVSEISRLIIPRSTIVINYGDERSELFSKIFRVLNSDYDLLDFNDYSYSLDGITYNNFLSELSILDAGTYSSFYMTYPDSTNDNYTITSQQLNLTVNETTKNIIPNPIITINYGDERNILFDKIFKTLNTDYDDLDFNSYNYSIDDLDYTKYLSELSVLDAGTYETFYIKYPDATNSNAEIKSQKLKLIINSVSKNVLPRPRIEINYGDERNTLFDKIFKVLNTDYDDLNFNLYTYSIDDLDYTKYLSELSLLDGGTYETFYIKYPDSTNDDSEIKSQKLYMTVNSVSKNIIPRPIIIINYGDEISTLFGKIFKVLNTDYDDLDFNLYRYSLDGTLYEKYLSDLSILDAATYNSFYIEYPDALNNDTIVTSQQLYLTVNETNKIIMPRPIITINYGDERNILFDKIFKTLNTDYDDLDFNLYNYSIDDLDYTKYLSELSILDAGIYETFYIKYPDATNSNAEIKSQKLKLIINSVSKNIIPRPIITINYGDERNTLFNKIFKVLNTDYDLLDFNLYNYSTDDLDYTKYLSEMSTIDAGTYDSFYVKYPDTLNENETITSQKLKLIVNITTKNIIPKSRIVIEYGDERNILFNKIFKVLNTDYDDLDFNLYNYSTDDLDYTKYLSELSILDAGTYETFYIKYPDATDGDNEITSQQLYLTVNQTDKNIIPRPIIIINYGDERNILFDKIFKTLNTYHDDLDFNLYNYSIDDLDYTKYLSELSVLDAGTYETFYIKYPDATNSNAEIKSRKLKLIVNSVSKNILPKPRIEINYGDERNTLFNKIFKVLNTDYNDLDFNLYNYSTDDTDYTKYLSELSILDAGTYETFYIKYPDSLNTDTETKSQKLHLTVNGTSKNIIPRSRIEIEYGDERTALFNKIFKVLNSNYDNLDFTLYRYSLDGILYEKYLSELSILDATIYNSFYVEYPDSLNSDATIISQKLYLSVTEMVRNIIPKTVIIINYGDERNILFNKIFKVLNTDYYDLDFNLYNYSLDDLNYTKYLSELSTLDAGTYETFYIKYPDSLNNDAEIKSQKLHLTVNSTSKNIIPQSRIEIEYGDERNTLFNKIFKVLNTDYDDLDFNSYNCSTDDLDYTKYLSELSILDAGTYDSFYIKYPDSLNSDAEIKSQKLYLAVNSTSKNIIPNPRIQIEYGDERNTLFQSLFKTLTTEYDELNLNNYEYSTDGLEYDNQLSELSIFDAGIYPAFYIKYPDSLNNDEKITSQKLYLIVNATEKTIVPRPIIEIDYGDERSTLFNKIFKVLNTDYDDLDFNLYNYSTDDSDYTKYLSELSILDSDTYETFYIKYPDATNNNFEIKSQKLHLTVNSTSKNILPRPRIQIEYGDERNIIFTKLFKTLTTDYDDLNFNSYNYSTDDLDYTKYLSEITSLDVGIYDSFYIKYPDTTDGDNEIISQKLYLVVTETFKNIIPNPRIEIDYGDERDTLFQSLFKVLNTDYDEINLNLYKYSLDGSEYEKYLSELSVLDAGTYTNFYIEYPDSINGDEKTTSQQLYLVVGSTSKNIIPRPIIIINYGDERNTLFDKVFKVLNTDYDDLDFNSYNYSTDDLDYTKYLSELSILDAGTYETFYIKYPDTTDGDNEITSQKLYLVVTETFKNIIPNSRIEIDYGDERDILFSKIFKVLTEDYNALDLNSYKYSIDGMNYTKFLSELTILDHGVYTQFYIEYPNSLDSDATITSQLLYMKVNETDKIIVPKPRIVINYGDDREEIIDALFRKLNDNYDAIDLNIYNYSFDNIDYTKYLSELSILDAGTYVEFYIKYPDSQNSDAETTSQLLYLTVNESEKIIIPRPRVFINYGDERNTLFNKIFKVSNTDYDDLDFNSYNYSLDNSDYSKYISELSILDAGTYDSFYVKYPDATNENNEVTSQKIYLVVAETLKNILPRPRIEFIYGSEEYDLFNNLFKTLTSDYDTLQFNSYEFSTDGLSFTKYLSELSILDDGTYETFYIRYPDSTNNDAKVTSQLLYLVVSSSEKYILPRPRIVLRRDEFITFPKLYKVADGYDYSALHITDFKFSFNVVYEEVSQISSFGIVETYVMIQYYNTLTNQIDEKRVLLIVKEFDVDISRTTNLITYGDYFDVDDFVIARYKGEMLTLKGLYIQMHNGSSFEQMSHGQIIDRSGETLCRLMIDDTTINLHGTNDFTKINDNILEFTIDIQKQNVGIEFNKSIVVQKDDMTNNETLVSLINNIIEGVNSDQYEFVLIDDEIVLHNIKSNKFINCTTTIESLKTEYSSQIIPFTNDDPQSEVPFIQNKLTIMQVREKMDHYTTKIRFVVPHDEKIVATKIINQNVYIETIRPTNPNYEEHLLSDFDSYDIVVFERISISQGLFNLTITLSPDEYVNNASITVNMIVVDNTELFNVHIVDPNLQFGDKLLLNPKFGETIIDADVEFDLDMTIPYESINYINVIMPETTLSKQLSINFTRQTMHTLINSDKFKMMIYPFVVNSEDFFNNKNVVIYGKYGTLDIGIGTNIERIKRRLKNTFIYGKLLNEYVLNDDELLMFVKHNGEYYDITKLFDYELVTTDFSITINSSNVTMISNIASSLSINKECYNYYYLLEKDIHMNYQIDSDNQYNVKNIIFSVLLNKLDSAIGKIVFDGIFMKYTVSISQKNGKNALLLKRLEKFYYNETNTIEEFMNVRKINNLYYVDIDLTIYPQTKLYTHDPLITITEIGFNIFRH